MTESFEELFRALHQFKKLNVVSMLPDELTKSFRPSPRLKLQKIYTGQPDSASLRCNGRIHHTGWKRYPQDHSV